jgi:hypothetical protein
VSRATALADVSRERDHQERVEAWGSLACVGQGANVAAAAILEGAGKVGEAILTRNSDDYREALVSLGAVVVAAIQAHDRAAAEVA